MDAGSEQTREDAGAAGAARRRRGPTKGQRREQAIVDAVGQLARERPIAELSVEQIAAAAGISRSAFYFYFESKYAALAAALAGVFEEINVATADFGEDVGDAPEAYLLRAFTDVAALWRKHEHLLIGMVDAAGGDPLAREVWFAYMDRHVDRLEARILAGRATGEIAAGPPEARELAAALLWMNERLFYLDRVRRAKPRQTAATVTALVGVWLAALQGGQAPAAAASAGQPQMQGKGRR
jgi:TetR/AcrR family transcriptional regulator, ethionamide resistance regulator